MDLVEENPNLWTPGVPRGAGEHHARGHHTRAFIRDCLPVNAVGLGAAEFERVHIDCIANRRLAGCGRPALSPGVQNPLPWLAEMMDVRKEQEPLRRQGHRLSKGLRPGAASDDDL